MNRELLMVRNGGRTGLILSSNMTMAEVTEMLHDPFTSHWLRLSYGELLERDPLAALNDAHMLYEAMCARFVAHQK